MCLSLRRQSGGEGLVIAFARFAFLLPLLRKATLYAESRRGEALWEEGHPCVCRVEEVTLGVIAVREMEVDALFD